jgi:hypothetical protein
MLRKVAVVGYGYACSAEVSFARSHLDLLLTETVGMEGYSRRRLR